LFLLKTPPLVSDSSRRVEWTTGSIIFDDSKLGVREKWERGEVRDIATMSGVSVPEADDGDTETDLSYDESFDLLSNHRRRYVLHYLQQNGEQATLGDLADRIAAWENDVEMEEVSYDERKRVYTSLQQVHLPRMDDLDVIEFDDRQGFVETGPAADDLDVYLEVVQGRDVPWSVFYLALTLLNVCLVGAAAVGTPLLSRASPSSWSLFVLMTFLVSALAHFYLTRTEMRLGENEDPPEKRVD
jgi:hypothetical protein